MRSPLTYLGTLLLLAGPALPQAVAATYTITTTTQQDARITRARIEVNTAACASVGLQPNCTQPAARAIVPGTNVYSDNQDFVERFLVKGGVQALQDSQNHQDFSDVLCPAYTAASQGTQGGICSALGVGASNCPSECR